MAAAASVFKMLAAKQSAASKEVLVIRAIDINIGGEGGHTRAVAGLRIHADAAISKRAVYGGIWQRHLVRDGCSWCHRGG